jgi:hypothetical protein
MSPDALAAKAVQLSLEPRRTHRSREQPGRNTDGKDDQHDKDERRLPAPPVVELQGHQLGILQ